MSADTTVVPTVNHCEPTLQPEYVLDRQINSLVCFVKREYVHTV